MLVLNRLGETSSSVLYTNNDFNMRNSKISASSIPWSKTNCHFSLWPINWSSVPVFSAYNFTDSSNIYGSVWSNFQKECSNFFRIRVNAWLVPVRFLRVETVFHSFVKLSFFFYFSKQFKICRSRSPFTQGSFRFFSVCHYKQFD